MRRAPKHPVLSCMASHSSVCLQPITAAEKRAMERRARMELEAMDDGDATEPEPDPEPEPAPVPVQVALTPPAKKKKKLPSNFLSM